MARGRLYFFVGVHFAIIAHYSIARSLRAYETVHRTVPFTLELSNPVLHWYASLAGIATGYGFFAPQVSGSFQLEVSLLHGGSSPIAHASPLVGTAHALVRYGSLLNRLQYIAETGTIHRQAKAIAHCLSQRIASRLWGDGDSRIRCQVYGLLRAGPRQRIYEHELPIRSP